MIEGFALEPQRPDRFHRRRGRLRSGFWSWFGCRFRLWFRFGFRVFFVVSIGNWRWEFGAGSETRDDPKLIGRILRIAWRRRIVLRQAYFCPEGIQAALLSQSR